jgi:hypothetical protein
MFKFMLITLISMLITGNMFLCIIVLAITITCVIKTHQIMINPLGARNSTRTRHSTRFRVVTRSSIATHMVVDEGERAPNAPYHVHQLLVCPTRVHSHEHGRRIAHSRRHLTKRHHIVSQTYRNKVTSTTAIR